MLYTLKGPDTLYYTYGQILIFDSRVLPGNEWTEKHEDQGFARRSVSVSFSTMNESGQAVISVVDSQPAECAIERSIYTTINIPSGKVCIEGVDEYPIERHVEVEAGWHGVTFSQIIEGKTLRVFLCFEWIEREERSRVLVADEGLSVPAELLEMCDESGA